MFHVQVLFSCAVPLIPYVARICVCILAQRLGWPCQFFLRAPFAHAVWRTHRVPALFVHCCDGCGISSECKPDVQAHVSIVSFDETLRMMASIRKPKCLKINGDDEREYLFLVKVRPFFTRGDETTCFCNCDDCVREKDWRSRKLGTPAV